MNTVLVVSVLVVVILVCLVYIMILLNKNSKSNSNSNNHSMNLSNKKVTLESLALPLKVEELDTHILFQSCVSVYDSFKALDYNKKLERKLDAVEWHHWQVSLLIALMKEHKNIIIPQPNKIFHQLILEMSPQQVENEFNKILTKYENFTDIRKSREDLREQIIWSAREVSIIFYYMTIGTY